jgi:hypothetical protein
MYHGGAVVWWKDITWFLFSTSRDFCFQPHVISVFNRKMINLAWVARREVHQRCTYFVSGKFDISTYYCTYMYTWCTAELYVCGGWSKEEVGSQSHCLHSVHCRMDTNVHTNIQCKVYRIVWADIQWKYSGLLLKVRSGEIIPTYVRTYMWNFAPWELSQYTCVGDVELLSQNKCSFCYAVSRGSPYLSTVQATFGQKGLLHVQMYCTYKTQMYCTYSIHLCYCMY